MEIMTNGSKRRLDRSTSQYLCDIKKVISVALQTGYTEGQQHKSSHKLLAPHEGCELDSCRKATRDAMGVGGGVQPLWSGTRLLQTSGKPTVG